MRRLANEALGPDTELDLGVAAQMLGVHRLTLRGWADRGLVPAIRLPNGQRRYRRGDIENLRRRIARDGKPVSDHSLLKAMGVASMAMGSPDDEIGPSEAAAILGVTANTVRKWAKLGTIPAIRLPDGFYRYRRREIDDVRRGMRGGV